MIRTFRGIFPVACAAALAAAGCKHKPPAGPAAFDADAKSGTDAKRSGAQLIQPNTIVTDDVNFNQQDQTDWKQLELKGKPGVLAVELHWDNANTDLNVDVFNSFGEQIGASPGPSPGGQLKKVAAPIDKPGVYFIRVQAPKKGDFSVYTLQTRWDGEESAPPPPPPPAPPPPTAPKKHEPRVAAHHEPPPKRERAPTGGVQGRIRSSYREGGQLILHIDKGTAAGVRAGTGGAVLDGPDGSNPLPGGSFVIDRVIDETKSVGHTALKSIGRNTRVLLYVK